MVGGRGFHPVHLPVGLDLELDHVDELVGVVGGVVAVGGLGGPGAAHGRIRCIVVQVDHLRGDAELGVGIGVIPLDFDLGRGIPGVRGAPGGSPIEVVHVPVTLGGHVGAVEGDGPGLLGEITHTDLHPVEVRGEVGDPVGGTEHLHHRQGHHGQQRPGDHHFGDAEPPLAPGRYQYPLQHPGKAHGELTPSSNK